MKIKHITCSSLFLATLLLGLMTAGCTHNNGPHDSIYGTWKLESMAIDGNPDNAYQGNMVWKFQNDIIEMDLINDGAHTNDHRFGTWTLTDSELLLDFSHSDNNYGPGEGIYKPFEVTRLPSGNSVLHILSKDSGKMTLRYDTTSGASVVYYLKRWG